MYSLKLDKPPCGYVANSVKEGEHATIVTREFISSEDGDEFIAKLEELPSTILQLLPEELNLKSSQIDHLLILIDKEGFCTVYANELTQIILCKPKTAVKKGDLVYQDDIADIIRLEFEDVEIPKNVGVAIIFSKDWRKGYFFDLAQVAPNAKDREYDIYSTLGHYYNYLFFQNLHKITEQEWNALFTQKWFPFIGLKSQTIKNLLSHVRSNWQCDDLLFDINNELKARLPSNIEDWKNSDPFKEHIIFIEKAAERFKEKDYISAVSILFPKIEGVLRKLDKNNKSQSQLAEAPYKHSNIKPEVYSAILPKKFNEYLKTVYFANFSPENPADISRNSVAHGVAKIEDYSEKSAILAFLVLEQIFFHIPQQNQKIKS